MAGEGAETQAGRDSAEQSGAPRPRPPRAARRGESDHYGVVRADPPPDDHQHSEAAPSFLGPAAGQARPPQQPDQQQGQPSGETER